MANSDPKVAARPSESESFVEVPTARVSSEKDASIVVMTANAAPYVGLGKSTSVGWIITTASPAVARHRGNEPASAIGVAS